MNDIIQGTLEWHAARLGKVTASRMADVMAKTKTGYGASRASYMAQLRTERLTGQPTAMFVNAAMQHGTDTEPAARAAYEFRTNVDVVEIGFVDHPAIKMAGASPDGMVAADGLLETKCPNSETHSDILLGKTVPLKYISQMQFQMACTGRAWCDFVSYDPRVPAEFSYFCRRVMRDDVRIAEMEAEVAKFLAELDAQLAQLTADYAPLVAAA